MVWIRKKRGLVSGILAVVFISTWLSLICQTCQAHADLHKPVSGDTGHEGHCLPGGDPETGPEPVTVDGHCINDCGCSAAVITVATIQPAGVVKDIETYKKKFDPAAPSLFLTQNHVAKKFYCRRRLTPEQAHYLPIERFCILLN